MNKKNNDYYDKKIDIELKRKALSEKYGVHFGETNTELPAEIEEVWLNSVEKIERQYENAKSTTVWEYIGKPACRKITELNHNEISARLNELFDLLNNNNIALDTICEVEEKELYRFITEELFEHEMNDMRMPGMTCHFIYEEFHPNAQHEIESAIDYFFRMTMGKMKNIGGDGYDILYVDEKNFKDAKGNKIGKKKVVNDLNNFLDSFDSFEINQYDIKALNMNEQETNSEVFFSIQYNGIFEGNCKACEFKGDGCFKLKPSEFGGWDIYHIDMPGLKIG
jgi:hypothetical protein